MPRLFRREAELLIAKPSGDSFFDIGPNAVKITDLRVAFNVNKHLSSDPNSCEIEVSNLAESTRAALQELPLRVFLSAGYAGNVKQIFSGDLRWQESKREQTGWLTKIHVGDGERAYKHARVNRSFKGGVQHKQLLAEVAGSMGLTIPKNVEDARSLVTQLVNGAVLEGPSHRELTRIIKSRGFDSWSIQDGRLQILNAGETRLAVSHVISKETGMIGSPGYGSPPAKGKPPTLAISTLLFSDIIPGDELNVQSRQTRGRFRAERVAHVGDTHGESWSTEIEAIPL